MESTMHPTMTECGESRIEPCSRACTRKPVGLPANWVFFILAKQGYYPRPSGYVSPQEQAELDAAEERKRVIAAREERFKAECDLWISSLSVDERNTIESGTIRMPDNMALRNYFRAEVWPKRQNGDAE